MFLYVKFEERLMPFRSFEVERLMSAPSETGSNHHQRMASFRLLPPCYCCCSNSRRIRTQIAAICCVVAIAVVLDAMLSTSFRLFPPSLNTRTDEHGSTVVIKPAHSLAPPTATPTQQPTTSPTHAPSRASQSAFSNNSSNSSDTDLDWSDMAGGRPSSTEPYHVRPLMTNASRDFVQRWCVLDHVDWYPSGDHAWQQRAPYFIIPGAKYSGTRSLAALLSRHPQVMAPREQQLKFFLDKNFAKFMTRTERTLVNIARSRMYALDYPFRNQLRENSQLVSFDATPAYLFYSDVLPRILCVAPWVKLVVLLSNPTDRVLQQFVALSSSKQHNDTRELESWIDKDLALMRQVGLLPPNGTLLAQHAGSAAEDTAWDDYKQASLHGLLGRSLYELQLRRWFDALRTIGRAPRDAVLILRTPQLQKQPQATLRRITKFLQLSPLPDIITSSSWTPSLYNLTNHAINTPAVRSKLNALFAPYNQRLQGLLRAHGFQK